MKILIWILDFEILDKHRAELQKSQVELPVRQLYQKGQLEFLAKARNHIFSVIAYNHWQ